MWSKLTVTTSGLTCQLRLSSRQVPLTEAAGGDVYAAQETRFGTRLLVGDVMGTGASAQDTARTVVAAWRELAVTEPSLPGIAVRLHTLIARSPNPERFVTALLATFGCCSDGVQLVCCGHPPPLLLRGSSASFVETFPAPPLGLMDLADGWCSTVKMPFGAGDQMLLYTDGASEARDIDGAEFPLARHAAAAAVTAGTSGDGVLDELLASLNGHLGEQRTDDILLVLASR
jgi:serine phosphatase RsbU (regulator of sigma subunit)